MMDVKLINLKALKENDLYTVEQAYNLFKKIYTPILEAAGEKYKPEYFYNETYLITLHHKNEVIGLTLCSLHHCALPDQINTAYFRQADGAELAFQINKERMVNISWVTVDERFRKSIDGFKAVDLLMGFGCLLARDISATAIVGFSRMDVLAHIKASNWGASPISEVNL